MARPELSEAETVVVTTTSEDAWFGLNEGPSNSIDDVVFAIAPRTPPSGEDSVTLPVADQGRASSGSRIYQGTPLAPITQLAYNSCSSTAATLASPML